MRPVCYYKNYKTKEKKLSEGKNPQVLNGVEKNQLLDLEDREINEKISEWTLVITW